MGVTTVSSSDSIALKVWSASTFVQALKKTFFRRFMSEDDNAIIQVRTELNKGPGDQITFPLVMQLAGEGRTGRQSIVGNFEKLSTYYDQVSIDTMRHGVSFDKYMTQQRVNFDLRKQSRSRLSDWWANRWDQYMINYLSGDTAMSFANNTGTAPTLIMYGGNATAKNNVDSTDTFDLDLIDRAIARSQELDFPLRPVNIDGGLYFVCLMHTRQAYNLRTSAEWKNIQLARLQGGEAFRKNPLIEGSMGIYNNTILYESSRCKTYTDYGTGAVAAARALFLGAQAGLVAFGGVSGVEKMEWQEGLNDYKDVEIVATAIWGLTKATFNSQDFGVIALDTAAAQPT
jgi:N4-gp56 family major capsid protein